MILFKCTLQVKECLLWNQGPINQFTVEFPRKMGPNNSHGPWYPFECPAQLHTILNISWCKVLNCDHDDQALAQWASWIVWTDRCNNAHYYVIISTEKSLYHNSLEILKCIMPWHYFYQKIPTIISNIKLCYLDLAVTSFQNLSKHYFFSYQHKFWSLPVSSDQDVPWIALIPLLTKWQSYGNYNICHDSSQAYLASNLLSTLYRIYTWCVVLWNMSSKHFHQMSLTIYLYVGLSTNP